MSRVSSRFHCVTDVVPAVLLVSEIVTLYISPPKEEKRILIQFTLLTQSNKHLCKELILNSFMVKSAS